MVISLQQPVNLTSAQPKQFGSLDDAQGKYRRRDKDALFFLAARSNGIDFFDEEQTRCV
ncbi:hypothetical protein GGD54_006012 [Rhizobium tropici]|uniref:Uncharacterized protein n=2 Tax=Rhizobium TaxID=379 RepID=A0A1C3XHF3_9HYPH|nr:hypothetical protein [Rhizobium tropici]MBB5596512.1 hypothetical protein [Rhizobium tropici]MBB6489240.1 hypothetical protein [Rhizobium lusitanum]MBB6495498.1 hypothetical protein [Rhizobium tropici]SCB51516.1 hypothetical protein GA0061101_14028 [Rhizobium lusitanum]